MARPRKYLDRDRIVVNPEWIEWKKEAQRQAVEDAPWQFASAGIDPTIYFPELDDKKIPDEGAWILILEEPHTILREQFRLPLLSMWRARPFVLNDGGVIVGYDDMQYREFPKQAVITTPAGDLHLWPHEYIIASDPLGLLSCEGAEIHQLGGKPVLDEDYMFYLQSRGIPYDEAVLMLFDTIEDTDFIYVTFPEEVTSILEGVGRPLHRHIALNPRKAG